MIRPSHDGLRWTRLPTNQSNFDSKNLKKESHENGYNVRVTMERDRKHLKILLIPINIGSLVLHVGNYRTRVSPSRTIVHMGTSSSATTDVLLSLPLSSLLPPTRSIRSPPSSATNLPSMPSVINARGMTLDRITGARVYKLNREATIQLRLHPSNCILL